MIEDKKNTKDDQQNNEDDEHYHHDGHHEHHEHDDDEHQQNDARDPDRNRTWMNALKKTLGYQVPAEVPVTKLRSNPPAGMAVRTWQLDLWPPLNRGRTWP